MELIFTSFGLSHRRFRDNANDNIFYRMPPVLMAQARQMFMPDYAILLLCDRIILDGQTYDRLLNERHWAFGEMANAVKILNDEGFLRIEDFDTIIEDQQALLKKMLERDLKNLDQWVSAMKESTASWEKFLESNQDPLYDVMFKENYEQHPNKVPEELFPLQIYRFASHSIGSVQRAKEDILRPYFLMKEALRSSRKRRKSGYRRALKQELEECLSYVNANLVLSETFQCGFHDWHDFQPFYREKFFNIGKVSAPEERKIECVKCLFEISFPELTFWDPKKIVRALTDKRIADLRNLVDSAVKGEVTFDREFATSVLHEVIGVERGIRRLRNIVSYATLPLSFIPLIGTPLQKVTEEAVGKSIEKKQKKEFRWFYLISELSEH